MIKLSKALNYFRTVNKLNYALTKTKLSIEIIVNQEFRHNRLRVNRINNA